MGKNAIDLVQLDSPSFLLIGIFPVCFLLPLCSWFWLCSVLVVSFFRSRQDLSGKVRLEHWCAFPSFPLPFSEMFSIYTRNFLNHIVHPNIHKSYIQIYTNRTFQTSKLNLALKSHFDITILSNPNLRAIPFLLLVRVFC